MKQDIEPRGDALIKRYKSNYSIPENAVVTEEMILRHWNLEKQLTRKLLESTPEDRWEIFEQCYSELYKDLPWLNELVHTSLQIPPEIRYKSWVEAIGPPPKKIYEIGSGKGRMITYLSTLGYDCKATEITRERGGKFLLGSTSVELGNTDGVHLDQFEEKNTYDVVLSDQVIEHLHPDDVLLHFEGVYNILNKKGHYILGTPQRFTGPHDVSKVFKTAVPEGMHLKEYTNKEIISIARMAGFKKIYYANKFTDQVKKIGLYKIFNLFNINVENQKKIISNIFLKQILLSEKIISVLPSYTTKKKVAKILTKLRLFNENVFLDIQKE